MRAGNKNLTHISPPAVASRLRQTTPTSSVGAESKSNTELHNSTYVETQDITNHGVGESQHEPNASTTPSERHNGDRQLPPPLSDFEEESSRSHVERPKSRKIFRKYFHV